MTRDERFLQELSACGTKYELCGLGNKYYFGGDAEDFARAVECWKKADAYLELFVCSRLGIGTEQNFDLSEAYRFDAAERWLFDEMWGYFATGCYDMMHELASDVSERSRELSERAAALGVEHAKRASDKGDDGWFIVEFYDLLMAAGLRALKADGLRGRGDTQAISAEIERWHAVAKTEYTDKYIADYSCFVDYVSYLKRMREIIFG